MTKEKDIENSIYNYLLSLGAVVEKMQGWKILIKKGSYNHMMTLQTKGACDIFCFYKWAFIGIEVKKSELEVNEWIKLKDRYENWEVLPKSYLRELDQIKYRKKILDNWWTFILTSELKEVKDYLTNI